jgi:membrane-associated phospholipid phosphatase
MSLGVHFPSDVLAGAITGIACAFIYNWILQRNSSKAL